MKTNAFDGVETFLAVAELKSFTAAASRLGVTAAAASKTIKQLEKRHGVVLFKRTTRHVALTEAGANLFAALRPAASLVTDAFSALNVYRNHPTGTLRLTVPRNLGGALIRRILTQYRQACPDVTLDLSLHDGTVDLLAGGYDAGIRLGQAVAQDMAAVPLTPPLRWSVVASPEYFARAGKPVEPEDLARHETIRYRFLTSGALHRWQFVRDGQSFHLDTPGNMIFNDTTLITEFACAGMGMAYLPDIEIENEIKNGELEQVLRQFMPTTSGLYLYFPSRTQQQPKLRAFIDIAMCGKNGRAGGSPSRP